MKVLVLGKGSIGQRHFDNLKELGHEVRSYDPATDPAGRHLGILWSRAVVIASPTDQHYQDIVDCQRAAKLIFCEKPIVSNLTEYRTLDPRLIMMVGYNLRFHSCVKRARQILGEGTIGKPLCANFVCAQYNNKPAYLRDGVVLNWSHEIDLAYHLLGYAEVERCIADADEVMAEVVLLHANHGCRTRIYLDYIADPQQRYFSITGDRGTLEVDLVRRHLFVTTNDGDLIESFAGKDSFDSNYLDEMRTFVDRCLGEVTIGCTAQEAFSVMDLCLRAKELSRAKESIGYCSGQDGVDPTTGQGHDAAGRAASPTLDHQRSESGQAD